ncbi:MAG: hypothetical protein M3142_02275 [Bacteroidota bacterium]|nr:hypothetical protein [Bacteroidota bacterium]
MTIATLQQLNDLAFSAIQNPVYLNGNQLKELFPPDPSKDENQLLKFGLIGHQPLKRSTEEKFNQFCQQKGITFRAYHDNKHYVVYKKAALDFGVN